jgi:uncharacterized protein with PQ loop repeat
MTLYGWIGGSLAVLYNIPQIYHVYRVKRVEGVSSSSLLLRIVSYGLVIYHSFLLEDPAILYTTSAGVLQLCIMYAQLWVYRTKEETVVLDI